MTVANRSEMSGAGHGATVLDDRPAVSIGIDAGVVAPHKVAVRGVGVNENFRVPPTLAGMKALSERLAPYRLMILGELSY